MTLSRFFLFGLLAALPAVAWAQRAAPAQDNLDLRFANGIAAVVEDRVITVDDIRREIAPLIPQIQRESRNEQEFNERLEALQDQIIQDMVDRVLMVKEFRKDGKMGIPPSYVDSRVSEILATQFEGDRSKFLAYLRSRGITQRDYRSEVEEDIIYMYMRSKMERSQSIISPVKVETFYNNNRHRFHQEDSVHMRMIQINRAPGETDDRLMSKASEVMNKLGNGSAFPDVAREHSQDSRRARGSDWGWQKRSDLKPEFSEVLFTLDQGQYTEPILTPEGVFVLYVEDRRHEGIRPIDEVRDDIERLLASQMARQAQERWLERLRRDGFVKYY